MFLAVSYKNEQINNKNNIAITNIKHKEKSYERNYDTGEFKFIRPL